MDGLVLSQSRIFVAQARIAQAKPFVHGGGATAALPAMSVNFTVVFNARGLLILNN
jgi:hypothetical protein